MMHTLPTFIDLTKANSLNRIPLPKQGNTGRDLYIEREEDEPEPETTDKPQLQSRKLEPKPIQQWKSDEWRDALKNKEFTDDGIDMLAKISAEVNSSVENIGARRLHTILEKILEDISFSASDKKLDKIAIDKKYVVDQIGDIYKDTDLTKFIL